VLGLLILTATVVVRAGGIGVLLEAAPPDFFRFLPEPNLDDVLAYFAAWITIGLGSIPSPDVFQRTMSAKDENTAVRASYLSAGLYLTIGFLPLISALGAKVLHPELLEGDAQMVLPQMVLQYGGLGLQVLFFGAVLSAVMSTTSGAILAPASVVGENIVKAFRPDLSDAQLLRAVRFSILGITFASVIMALLKGNIYELVAASSTMSLVALFVPLTLGLYWKGARVTGAIMAIVLGTLSWLWAEFGEWGVPGLLVGLAVSLLAMLVGSFWGKKKAG
jgi:SSS family solute:Na+ symporter